MTRLDENALLRSQLTGVEVSLQALKEENARLRDESVLLRTGRDAAREYADRLEREVLYLRGERAAVVAYLRSKFPEWPAGSNGYADEIERGEHRRKGDE